MYCDIIHLYNILWFLAEMRFPRLLHFLEAKRTISIDIACFKADPPKLDITKKTSFFTLYMYIIYETKKLLETVFHY